MKASVAQINYLNIFLIIVSCIAAYLIPFELFLFAYAVLGPLHYLTEISWLHERKYFTTGKYDFLYLGILTVFLVVGSFLPDLLDLPSGWGGYAIYIAFFSAPILVLIKNVRLKIFGCAIILASTYFLFNPPSGNTPWILLISVLLPTVIHVYVFTGAFMLFGAMKEKGYTGYISIVIFLVCSLIFFFYRPGGYQISDRALELYSSNPFAYTNYALFKVFNVQESNGMRFSIIYSESGIAIMRFIAFAYTYHYLNWFSKTTIIGWHKQSKLRLGIIFLVWAVSVVLYYVDYSTGFKWLFALSFLHVFLEFPLNYKTFITIGQGIGGMITGKKSHT